MGLFSSIWKGVKNVFKGIMKVFSPILKPIAKILDTKWGKALMLAISVFTLGTALMAGGAAFSGAQAAGQGFLQSFVEGGKAFVKTLFGMSAETGPGAPPAEGALPAAQEVAAQTAINPMATNMAGAEAATTAGATVGGDITGAIGELAGGNLEMGAQLGDTASVLNVGSGAAGAGGAGGSLTGGSNLLSQGQQAAAGVGDVAAGVGGAGSGSVTLPTAGAVTPQPLQSPIPTGQPGGAPASMYPNSPVPDASSVGKLMPEMSGTGNAAQTAAAFTPKEGNWLSKAAQKAWDFVKSDEGQDMLGSSLEGLWDAEQQDEMFKHLERYDRMWRNPNDPGNVAMRRHQYYTPIPENWPSSDQSRLVNRRASGYRPTIPYRRAPQGG